MRYPSITNGKLCLNIRRLAVDVKNADDNNSDGLSTYSPYSATADYKGGSTDLRSPDPLLPDDRKRTFFLEDDIPKPIKRCAIAKEMMMVVEDALKAHRAMYNMGILHQDISDSNVLFVSSGNCVKGVLQDWDASDNSFDLEHKGNMILLKGIVQRFRLGNWHFMSTLRSDIERKSHTLADDLESFFYLVLHVSLARLTSNKSSLKIRCTMNLVFAEAQPCSTSRTIRGGIKKYHMLTHGRYIRDIKFEEEQPLAEWLHAIRMHIVQLMFSDSEGMDHEYFLTQTTKALEELGRSCS